MRLVLVVEDQPAIRERVKRWLEAEGFKVRVAAEYDSAMRELETCSPLLLCIDSSLPRESGLELVEAIRKRSKVPIIMMSERHSPEDMAEAEQAGANAFLKKPFERELLMKYVRSMLEGPYSSRPTVRRLRRVSNH
ncbi:MAG TPA: response regulator [Polyangiaceae bacterium]|jgi:DNA-binding response OmpR family regulator